MSSNHAFHSKLPRIILQFYFVCRVYSLQFVFRLTLYSDHVVYSTLHCLNLCGQLIRRLLASTISLTGFTCPTYFMLFVCFLSSYFILFICLIFLFSSLIGIVFLKCIILSGKL